MLFEPQAAPGIQQVLQGRLEGNGQPGQRQDPWHVALCIEGGGMRGVITGGMSAALEAAGCQRLFDSVYGSSIGATSGAYFVAGQAQWAADTFELAAQRPDWIRLRRLPRGEVLPLGWLFQSLIFGRRQLDTQAVLGSTLALHPLLLRATWGAARSAPAEFRRRGLAWDAAALRWSLERAARAPCLCGWPWGSKRREAWDAGLVEAMPLATPLRHGATHLLVLRSRSAGQGPGLHPAWERALSLGVRHSQHLLAHQGLVAYRQQALTAEALQGARLQMLTPRGGQELPGTLCDDPELLARGRQAGWRAGEHWARSLGA